MNQHPQPLTCPTPAAKQKIQQTHEAWEPASYDELAWNLFSFSSFSFIAIDWKYGRILVPYLKKKSLYVINIISSIDLRTRKTFHKQVPTTKGKKFKFVYLSIQGNHTKGVGGESWISSNIKISTFI